MAAKSTTALKCLLHFPLQDFVFRTNFYPVCRSINFQKCFNLNGWVGPGDIPHSLCLNTFSLQGRVLEENIKTAGLKCVRHSSWNWSCTIYIHWIISKYCCITINYWKLQNSYTILTAIQELFSNIIYITTLTYIFNKFLKYWFTIWGSVFYCCK